MDQSGWHPYLRDPVLSHGLVASEAEAIGDGLRSAEHLAHLGRFVEAHKILNSLGQNAQALPAYWLVRGSLHGYQGIATALQDLRQIEERFPDESVQSPYRLLHAFQKATVIAKSEKGTEEDKLESSRLGAKIQRDLLVSVESICSNSIVIHAMYVRFDRLSMLGLAGNDELRMTKAVFTRCLEQGDIDAVRLLPNLMTDLYPNPSEGCTVAIELCDEFLTDFPDRSSETVARVKGDCFARLYQLNVRSPVSATYLRSAKEQYTICDSTAGLLDIGILAMFQGIQSLVSDTDNWGTCFNAIDEAFEELQKAQFYRHQPTLLKAKERMIDMLEEPAEPLIEIAYQYKAFATASGNSINGIVCIILAQAEVQETDDLDQIVSWCQAYKEQEGAAITTDNHIAYLNTLITAYRRMGKEQEIVDAGNEFIEIYKSISRLQECAVVCGVVMQSYLNRCVTMLPDDFADALENGLEWLSSQITWFSGRGAKNTAADLAVNYCFLLFTISVRLALSTETVLVLTNKQVGDMIRKVLAMVDTRFVATHSLAVVEAAQLGLEHRFAAAVKRLRDEIPSRLSQRFRPLPPSVEAHLQYWSAWWTYQLVAESDEISENVLSTRERLKHIERSKKWFTAALEAYVELKDAQMCLACHFDLGKTIIAEQILQPDMTQRGRNNIEQGADHFLKALDIADQIRDNLAGESLTSYLFKARMSGGSFITLNNIMAAILQVHLPQMTWDWVQRFKARSLSDMLKSTYDSDEISMQRFYDDLDHASAGLPWIDMPLADIGIVGRLRKLTIELKTARPRERAMIRQEMRDIRQAIKSHPRLAGFAATGGGEPASIKDLIWASQQAGSQDMLFVDYFDNHDGSLGISYFSVERWGDGGIGAGGPANLDNGDADVFVTHHLSATGGFHYTGFERPVLIDELPLKVIKEWKEEFSTTRALRDEGALESFATLTPIVSPLCKLTRPGKLIVICPNGRLSGVPIHAIPTGTKNELGGPEVLIERNPIVYVPCMSALRQCVLRAKHCQTKLPAGCSAATVVGAYDKPGPVNDKVYEALHDIADVLGAQTAIGGGIDKTTFMHKALTTSQIFHFFGHQRNERRPFHERYLQLDGTSKEHLLAMQDLARIKFVDKAAPLVTLMACSSAESQPVYGEDPLGLVPVMLMAGAVSVIGTLWSAHWPSAMKYSRLLYEGHRDWKEKIGIVDLARIHQAAVLALKKEKPEPYFWASFVLNGSWFQ